MPYTKDLIVFSGKPMCDVPDAFVGEYLYRRFLDLPQDLVVEIQYETGEKQTIGEILSKARKVASYLLKKGIKPEDKVCIYMDVVLEYTPIALGIILTGATFSYLRPDILKNKDYLHRIGLPKLVFVTSKEKLEELLQAELTEIVFVGNDGSISLPKDVIEYEKECLEDDGCAFEKMFPVVGNPSKILHVITFTSGSTGLPKPIMLSHKAMMAIIKQNENTLFAGGDASEKSVSPCFFSVNHIGGYLMRLISLEHAPLSILIDGGNIVEKYLKAIETYKCNVSLIIPLMVPAIQQTLSKGNFDLSSLKHGVIMGGYASKKMFAKLKQLLNLETLKARLVFSEFAGNVMDFTELPGSVGTLCPGNEAKVVDIDTGKRVGPNKVGELCLRGPTKFLGYYNMPERTSQVVDAEGFYHNADLVYYDEDCNFYYFDRLQEVIRHRSAGLVSSQQIENDLIADCSDEIREVSIIGVPDAKSSGFQVLRAVVVPADPNVNVKTLEGKINKILEESGNPKLEGGLDVRMDVPRNNYGRHKKVDLIKEYVCSIA